MPTAPFKIKSLLLDVNVCIDLIVNRTIPPSTKKRFFAILFQNEIDIYIPAFSIDTIFYILNSSMKIDKKVAKNAVHKLVQFTKLLHSTDESIHQAFASHFSDFEDGLINALAETNNVDAIITHNISDFSKSALPVYRPAEFIALYNL